MEGSSNRDLWQLITGRFVLHPPEFVADELSVNKSKLLSGLDFFKRPSQPSGEALKQKNLDDKQIDFIKKLSSFIGLDETQTYDVYCLYLINEYRGSEQQLKEVLSVERHVQQLQLAVRDYYHSERLYLLRALHQLLSCWQENPAAFPYAEVYNDFVKPLYDNQNFITKLVQMYKDACLEPAPTWETHGPLMNERQASTWLLQNLKEQNELLELILLYYKNVEHAPDSLLDLAQVFKRQGFGRRQLNKHLLDEVMDPVMSRIGFLQVILLIEGADVEYLQECYEAGSCEEHHLLKSDCFRKLDSLLCGLGDIPPHGPLVLLAALFHQMAPREGSQLVVRKCGNRGLQLRVFQYLSACLQMEPFSSKSMLGNLAHSVVYGLLTALLAVFDEATLGEPQAPYELTTVLLKRPFLADNFWHTVDSEGLRSLLTSACLSFPLDSRPLLSLCASLATASPNSATQVIELLRCQQLFTEYLDQHTPVTSTAQPMYWRLTRHRRPYPAQGSSLLIPEGTLGKILPGEVSGIVQWELTYDAFEVFVGELELLLAQLATGAGMVEECRVQTAVDTCRVLHALLESDLTHARSLAQLPAILILLNQIVHRFSQLQSPPLELLSACLNVLAAYVTIDPSQVWHNLRQTGLLPSLTPNIASVEHIISGAGLHTGYYGRLLAGSECTQGTYPLTGALLSLLARLVQPLSKEGCADALTACVMMVTREIFPQFARWRYCGGSGGSDVTRSREQLGQSCLRLFHNVLNLLEPDSKQSDNKWGLRAVTVYSLLFTESGRTLLDIVGTGVDPIQQALNTQASALEGSGVELIHMVRLAFSVLNRLLLLRPADTPVSPVEHCLSAQPANRNSLHVVTMMAQYLYHRHDARLPALGVLLLRRLAALYPMSLLACLGAHAQPTVTCFLARLQAHTEDMQLKVSLLELLTVCVDTQPGLLESFLNLAQLLPTQEMNTDGAKTETGRREYALGTGQSCLTTLLALIQHDKQGSYWCPAELLCAAVEFTHALWRGQRQAAMTVLRQQKDFWPCLCLSLTRDLQPPEEGAAGKEVQTVALIMKILAQELYLVDCLNNEKLDANLDTVLIDLKANNRFRYWSKYLLGCMKRTASEVVRPGDSLSDHSALQLLMGFRDLLVVLTTAKKELLEPDTRAALLGDLLTCVPVLLTSDVTPLHAKLASIASASYLTLLRHWIGSVSKLEPLFGRLTQMLEVTCSPSQSLPAIQIGLVAAMTLVLQHARRDKLELGSAALEPAVQLVCSLLQLTGVHAPPQLSPTQLKLQVAGVSLLEELVESLDSVSGWLPVLQRNATLPCLVAALEAAILSSSCGGYVQAVLLLCVSAARHPAAAESIHLAGLTQHVCLSLTNVCSKQETASGQATAQTQGGSTVGDTGDTAAVGGRVYSLSVTLHTRMLASLRYGFLPRALDFVGCHTDRMAACLEAVGRLLDPGLVAEAISTVRFLQQLAQFRKDWFLHLPHTLHTLMTQVCLLTQRCVSLLLRPRFLQHLLEKAERLGGGEAAGGPLSAGCSSHRLATQSSLLDTPPGATPSTADVTAEITSAQAQRTHAALLETLGCCLQALTHFSPDLVQVLLDQSVDVSEWEALLELSFNTPGMEQQERPSFGTLLSAANMCVRLAAKLENKGGSSSGLEQSPYKSWLVRYVQERCLLLCMSQAVLVLKQPALPARDKQLLKRELATELTSILSGMQRQLRRSGSTGGLPSPQLSKSNTQPATARFSGLLNVFIAKVLT